MFSILGLFARGGRTPFSQGDSRAFSAVIRVLISGFINRLNFYYNFSLYKSFLPNEIFNDGHDLALHVIEVHLSTLAFDHFSRVLRIVGHKRADHNVQNDAKAPAV